MATTALFVEILVIGATAELWIVSLLLACAGPSAAERLMTNLSRAKDFGPATLIFVLAITYGIGWVANFTSERLFKLLFQRRLRDPLFEGSGIKYEDARLLVLQKASSQFLHEVQLDRHVIRIARANALNFALLAASLLLHVRRIETAVLATLLTLLVAASIGSFYQWRTRYSFQYTRVAAAAKLLGIAPGVSVDASPSSSPLDAPQR